MLGLELEDAGFNYSVLSEFRQRLVSNGMEQELLDTMLIVLGEQKLLKKRGQQRTDSTHVLAAVRHLNRLENIGETMRATLNVLATVAPDWLQKITPPEWYDRYKGRVEESRLPRQKKERATWIKSVGDDGIYLLNSIYGSDEYHWLWKIPAVNVLRRVWLYQYCHLDGVLHLRKVKDLPPNSIRFDSPYDTESHYSTKRQTSWSGYKVHITESCDDTHPHIITHVETTIAPKSDANMSEPIHNALAQKNCLPDTHIVDAGYMDAEQIVTSQKTHDINLLGPVRPDVSWQAKAEKGYASQDFQIDWKAQTANCPRGVSSDNWFTGKKRAQTRVSRFAALRPVPI